MKKEYVKPVMESEAFVANEYCIACWTVTCQNPECGAVEYGYNALKNEVTTQSYLGKTTSVHTGKLGEEEKVPCTKYVEDTYPDWCDKWWEKIIWDEILSNWFTSQKITEYHPVSVTSGWGETHPNASV